MPASFLKLSPKKITFAVGAALALSACGQKAGAPQTAANSSASSASTGAPPNNYSTGLGQRILIKADALPKPFETESASNSPTVVPRPAGAELQLPPGFAVSEFSSGDYKRPRWMLAAENGDLFLADYGANKIYLLRDANSDGRIDNASERFVFAEGLNLPFGMAINGGYFYIGNTDSVVRAKYQPGQTKLEGPMEKIADLPGDGGHSTRDLLFSPDGRKLYVAVGSKSNVDDESKDPRRATIGEYNPDGSGYRIYASGLRNPVGLAWNPVAKELWTTVNERDRLGDDLVPDYATSVKDGAFYGWPFAYLGPNEDPRRKGERPDLVAKAVVPDVLLEAHGAPLGIVFYTGKMFPAEYQNSAFVALHGSWNRSRRQGYKLIRIPFKDGKPEGGYENFMLGWMTDGASKEVWGRPVGLTVMRDGSLLVVDDGGNKVWRVTYSAKA
jgi:glucose/arabinose dehydrogenase